MKETILIVGNTESEELQNNAVLLGSLLPQYNMLVAGPQAAISHVRAKDMHVMAVILAMPAQQHAHALHTIMELRKADGNLPIVVWVHYGEESFAKDAIRAGAYDFVTRPVSSDKLILSLQHACDLRRLRTYVGRLEQHIAEQSDISPFERDAIMMNQMQHFLVDEEGNIKPLKSLEKEIIVAALSYTGGCVSRAARSLGIGRSTLYRKVGEYKIQDYTKREYHTTRPARVMSANGSFSAK